MGVYYLFGRYKFNWDGGDLGTFMTFKMVLSFVGNFISMGFLTQKLKLSDPAVGICACISVILSSLIFATANSNFMMFVGMVS